MSYSRSIVLSADTRSTRALPASAMSVSPSLRRRAAFGSLSSPGPSPAWSVTPYCQTISLVSQSISITRCASSSATRMLPLASRSTP